MWIPDCQKGDRLEKHSKWWQDPLLSKVYKMYEIQQKWLAKTLSDQWSWKFLEILAISNSFHFDYVKCIVMNHFCNKKIFSKFSAVKNNKTYQWITVSFKRNCYVIIFSILIIVKEKVIAGSPKKNQISFFLGMS